MKIRIIILALMSSVLNGATPTSNAPFLKPKEAIAKMTIPEGFEVKAFVAEPDRSRELENACRARLQRQKLLTYPNSCGRTMSQLLGTTRAMRLKAAHEQRHGFTYAAVVFSRWDVLWLSPTLADALLADPVLRDHFTAEEITEALDPAGYCGDSIRIARDAAAMARALSDKLKGQIR